MFSLFKDAWNGQASLAKAFWLVYVVFGAIVGGIILLGFRLFDPSLIHNTMTNKEAYISFKNLYQTICLPYTVYSAVCVWRCAVNSSTIWKILARIVVVFGVIGGVAGLYMSLTHTATVGVVNKMP